MGIDHIEVPANEIRIVAIDPGDVHVGVAQGVGLRCYQAFECSPFEAAHSLKDWLGADGLDRLVVCEEYRIYPWASGAQHWSECKTPELIGVIKWLCETEGIGARLVMQPASIQKPTEAILRAKKIPLLKAGPHAKSAQLHAYYYMLRNPHTLNGRFRDSQSE